MTHVPHTDEVALDVSVRRNERGSRDDMRIVPTKDMILKNAKPIGEVVEALVRKSLRSATSGCNFWCTRLLIQPSQDVLRRLDGELDWGPKVGISVRRSDSVSKGCLHHDTLVVGC